MSSSPPGAVLQLADDDTVVAPTELPRPAAPAAPPRENAVLTVVRRGLVVLGIMVLAFVLFCISFSGLAHARSQVGLQRRFSAELANAAAPIGGAIAPGAPVADLRIPRIGVHEVVVEGTRSSQLRTGPGHLVGSSLPGQPGNAVIAGRRTFYGGPFRRLDSLRAEDTIEVTTGQGRALFRVTGVAHVPATEGGVLADYGDDRLTLFTADSTVLPDRRLVVTATLTGAPFRATPLRRTLDAEGLGLTGERGAMAELLVWLELLLALALLAVFVRSRWSWISTWVVFTPALALLLWMVFQSAVRLMPATL